MLTDVKPTGKICRGVGGLGASVGHSEIASRAPRGPKLSPLLRDMRRTLVVIAGLRGRWWEGSVQSRRTSRSPGGCCAGCPCTLGTLTCDFA
jgi:hypothetical protein